MEDITMLTLKDLMYDAHDPKSVKETELADALQDIKNSRSFLGKITVRDMMEAVYGTAYTIQVLGETGGNDVLMEEMTAMDDLRESLGKERRDVGGNRLPLRDLSNLSTEEKQTIQNALQEQLRHTTEQVDKSVSDYYMSDAKAYRRTNTNNDPYIEDEDEFKTKFLNGDSS